MIKCCLYVCVCFRQKKLEKVMEEEGLKDEEVMFVGVHPGPQGARLHFLHQVSFGAREAAGSVTGI